MRKNFAAFSAVLALAAILGAGAQDGETRSHDGLDHNTLKLTADHPDLERRPSVREATRRLVEGDKRAAREAELAATALTAAFYAHESKVNKHAEVDESADTDLAPAREEVQPRFTCCPGELLCCDVDEAGCDETTCMNIDCLPLEFVCDCEEDCFGFDGSNKDEIGCEYFFCDDGRCLGWSDDDISKECDGRFDCRDGSDENCAPCDEDEYECNNGKCEERQGKCDFDYDCEDRSDEPPIINPDDCPPCDERQYRCDNGYCIPARWECDGEDDCLDLSDEQDC